MKIGIIGGGILGLTLGHNLSRRGYRVTLFEKTNTLGGLAGHVELGDGVKVDKYYHCISSGDKTLLRLINELDIDNHLHFANTKMGFFYDGKLFPMTNPIEFMRFPPLSMLDRIRLAYTLLYSLKIKDWNRLEKVGLVQWLIKKSGKRAYRNIWKPLLRAKFDGDFDQIPATYIWSRIRRMFSTHDKSQKQSIGYLTGGYKTLIDALGKKIREHDGDIHLNQAIKRIRCDAGRAIGLDTQDGHKGFDRIVCTIQNPYFASLLPDTEKEYKQQLSQMEYLSLVCILLEIKNPLSIYHTINITSEEIPFTGVIETTNLIDKGPTNGSSLVYLPKYVAPENKILRMSIDEIYGHFMENLKKMFPEFNEDLIEERKIFKESLVEPVHPIGGISRIPDISTPIHGLYLANTAQIYPELVNCESVVRHALKAHEKILDEAHIHAVR